MCSQLLGRYNAKREAFLQRILTGDESWVHHYGPEYKTQWMEYKHKTCSNPRKFKVVASARKVLFTVFSDIAGVVHIEFLEQGQTVNSDVFSVLRTQSCKTTMRARKRDAKLMTLLKATGTYDPTSSCI
ncbi:transposase [Elysia marginata]|uniref:Transposase n=1 Tax=Elysia marginata TaxID=1093978 RepID=A0AAV4ECY9_9GAST|nr:transposase [Elysia marginata]